MVDVWVVSVIFNLDMGCTSGIGVEMCFSRSLDRKHPSLLENNSISENEGDLVQDLKVGGEKLNI